MGYYHVAQICLNGHCISSSLDSSREANQKFCDKCGAATITACQHCGTEIRGKYESSGVVVIGFKYPVPAYCYACGKPFPWTASALESAAAIILEEDSISDAQQSQLIEVLPDIITETPKTNLATVRFKKALASVGKFTADSLRQFAIDFGCELARQQLGL